jgi:GEVED domain/Secretion system C-terminal sorting domain/SprB repeat
MNKFFRFSYLSIILISAFLMQCQKGFAQASLYHFNASIAPGAYQDIQTTPGVINTGLLQSGAACNTDTITGDISLNMPLGFLFCCKKYSQVRISNNGFLLLGQYGTVNTNTTNAALGTLNVNTEGVIQPMGADLVASTNLTAGTPSISYGNLGGNFIVQYANMARTSSPNDIINFQVQLSPSGQIKYIYGLCTPSGTSTTGVFVALRSNHISDGKWMGVPSGGSWSAPNQSASSTGARFTAVAPANSPALHTVYTFSWPNCANPSYTKAPVCANFENAWIDTLSYRPDTNWTNVPSRGNGAWAKQNASTTSTNWVSASNGLYTPNGANSTSSSARFHSTTTPAGVFGDLYAYIDFSNCPTANKELTFYYINTGGGDTLNVFMSTTGPNGSFTKLALNGASTKLGTNAGWTQYTVSLGAIGSSTCVFRFRATADLGNAITGTDIGLDEVCFGTAPTSPPLIETLPYGGVAICAPGQGTIGTNIMGNGGISYSWSPSLGLSATNLATVIATPTVTTIYTVTGTDAACNTATSTITVNVSPSYNLSLSASSLWVCNNGTATITANDTIYGPATLPTSYCPGLAPTNNVASFCITNVDFGSINNTSSGICPTSFYTDYSSYLSTNVYAGGIYSFTGTLATANGSMSVWIDFNRNGIFETTEYTSIVTGAGAGNPYTQNISIPANALPGLTRMRVRTRVTTSGITAADACTQFSSGGEIEDYAVRIIKSPNTILNIAWLPTTYLNNTNQPIVVANSVANTTTYTTTITDAYGCNTSAQITISVQPLGCGNITANPLIACVGGTSTLKSNVTGGGQPYSYLWYGPNISNTATIQVGNTDSVIVTPSAATVYTLQVTDACGNTCSQTYSLTVYPTPAIAVVNANGGGIQICATNANNVSLKASGALNYTWSPVPNFISASGDSVNISVVSNTSYLVVGTDANGCTNSITPIVTYRPNYPITLVANPPYVCAGGNSTISVSDTVFGTTSSANTYCITNLHVTAANCIDTVIFNTLTDYSSSCTLPSYTPPNANYQTTIVAGQSVSLKVSLTPFGYACAWLDVNQDGIFDASEFHTIIINSNTNTISFVVPANATLGNTRLRVRSKASFITSSEACTTFIEGETQDYTVRIVGVSPSNIVSYSWSPAASFAINNTNPAVTNSILATSPYVVTTTDVNGCTKASAVLVTVAPLNCGNVTSSMGTTICSGISTMLTANHTGGGPTFTYNWQSPAGSVGTTKNITVSPITTTTYTVTTIDGCSPSGSCTRTITINVNTSPTVSIAATPSSQVICGIGNASLQASGAASYVWLASNSPSFLNASTGANVIASPVINTTYTLIGTDANGCTNSDTAVIIFSPANALTATSSPGGIGLCNSSATLMVTDTIIGSQSVLPFYCNNSTPTSSTQADIINVAFSTLANASSCTTTGAGASILNKYADYTTLVAAPDVFNNSIHNFSVTVADCGGNSAAQIIKIYIDFNRNNSFADAFEEVYVSPTAIAGPHTESGSIYIPTFALAGVAKMRVIVSNTTNPNTFTACGNYANGETEDYLVNIKTTPIYPNTFNWNPGNLSGNNLIVSPTATTIYTVTSTNGFGCTAQGTTILTVGGVVCNAITTPNATICQGDTALLTANPTLGTPPYTYVWSNGDTSKVSKVYPSVTTTFTVVSKDACNATCSKTITITVIPKPTLTVAQSLPVGNAICVSGTNTLTASSNAVGAVYNWEPAINLSATNTAAVTVANPAGNQTYTITVTSNVGCSNTTTFISLYSPPFSVTASANVLSVCPNGSSTLAVSDTVLGILNSPNYAAAGALHTSTSPCIINVEIANTYTNNTANVCALPGYLAATAAPVATVYSGLSFSLDVTTSTNNSISPCKVSAWIDWNRNGIFDTTEWVAVSNNSIGNTPTTINITVPSFASAGYTRLRIRSRVSTVNGPTNATTTFASGETEDYLIHVIRTDNEIANVSYAWNGPAGAMGSGITKVASPIPANAIYTVTATNAYGCTGTSTVGVNVQVFSSLPITGDGVACEGLLDTIVAHPRFGGAPYSYTWAASVTNSIVTTYDSIAVINLTNSTTFTVTITDGCNSTVTNTFFVNFVPNANFFAYANGAQGVCGTGGVNLVTYPAMSTYSWSPTTFLSTSNAASVTSINPTATTIYTVIGTDAFGCSYTGSFEVLFSNPITVTANSNPLSICSGQSATITIVDTFTGTGSMPTNYCGSSAANSNNEEILNVQLGTINNTSDCITAGPGPGSVLGQYANYTTLPPQVVYSNDILPFSVTMSSCNFSTLPNGVKILIDFNRDGDFFDAGELAYVSPTALNGAHTESGNITVPNVVSPGLTRVRVIMTQTGNPAGINSCGIYAQGETEEYIINLINTPTYVGTTYTWSAGTTPSTGDLVTVSPTVSTTYSVTMSNAAGCTAVSSVTVLVGPLSAGTITETAIGNTCIGSIDTITANPIGGGEPYLYLWSNGDTTRSIEVVIPATVSYTLTISDACGNTVTTFININSQPPPPITINATPSNAVICATGSVNLTASCATCATVKWINTNQNTATINATPLVSSIYTVVGTDGNGCTGESTILVNKSFAHNTKITQSPFITCINNSTTLQLADSTIGSTFSAVPFNYCTPVHSGSSPCLSSVSFSNMSNTTTNTCTLPSYTNFSNKIANVIAGTTVPITVKTAVAGPGANATISLWIDFNRDGAFSIGEYQSIVTSLAPNTAAIANIIIPSTAVPGYTAMRIRAKSAGTAILATDACVAFGSGETEDYVINIFNIIPVVGNAYSWSPSTLFTANTGNPITTLPLAANTIFTVQGIDANGCTYTATKNILVNPSIIANATATKVNCFGFSSGTIKVVATGGTSPYIYTYLPALSTAVGHPDSAINVGAGVYTITAQDAVGCESTISVTVISNPNIVVSVAPLGSGCFGTANGTAVATVSGGFAPYNFSWLDSTGNPLSSNTNTLSNLSAGTYSVLVNDSNNCFSYPLPYQVFTVSQPSAALAGSIFIDSVVKCFNETNGVIRAVAAGGTPPYAYELNGSTIYYNSGTFIGLGAGVYTIIAKDANLCTFQFTATLLNPPLLTVTATVVNPTCAGDLGTITITPIGGTGVKTNIVNGLPPAVTYNPGPYTIISTDAKGCYSSIGVTIIAPTAITVSASANALLCNGDSTAITTSATGGTGTITYQINNATPLAKYAAGTYTIKATDANGCTKTTSVTITAPASMVVSASANALLCNGDSTAITTSAIGGTGTKTFLINNATPLAKYAAGTYTIKATDANGCTKTTSVTITAPTSIVLSASANALLCNGDSTAITTSATGGTGTITYQINNATPLAKYPAGTYTIKATDANGCTKTTSVTITAPASMIVSASANALSCNGDSTAIITSTIGGTGTITYQINNATPLAKYPAGTYTIKATDANGCTKTTSVTIIASTAIVLSASANALLCNGDSTAITTSATGGTGTITYQINNATPLAKYPVGTYTIKATDANGCTKTTSVTITAPASMVVSASANALLCNGDSTAITTSATGGTGTITYQINNATPLAKYAAGTYTIKATDANGCTKTTSVTITAPASMVVSASANALLCNGDSTAITTSAIGGTGTKTFLINNATPLAKYAAGTYTIKATDANGCTKTTSVTITAPTSIVLSASANALLCNGDSTAITTSATGGTGTITYQINNATPLAKYPAGTYTIKATDANGCTKTTSVTITAPASMIVSASANALSCNGDSTAIITSTIGGTGTITYQINNATPLAKYAAGTYTIKATDANGCTKTTSVTITAPASMIVSASANALLCNGDSTAITTSATGGTGTITYQINNATPLAKYPASTYTIKATDANGCTKTTSVTITAPASMNVSASANALLCNGDSTAITTSATGGTGTITYQINNATPLAKYPAGTYTIKATDANGCTKTTSVIITAPTAIVLSASANALLCNGDSTAITTSATGGTGTKTFLINNATPFAKYPAGTYTIKATDANGCTKTTSVTITAPASMVVSASANALLCNGDSTAITTSATGGTGTITYQINNATPLAKYPAGTYTIKATDVNGCTKTTSVTITAPTAITVSASANALLCNGDSTAITTSATGGTGTKTFLINNATPLAKYPAGTYTIKVTDANGCTKTTSVTITAPASMVVSASANALLCNGDSTAITTSATGGTGTITYQINNATPLAKYPAGTYTIKATDANGCTKTTSVTITAPASMIVSASANALLCNGDSTAITTSATGGTGTITYQINNATPLAKYPAGTYTIKATDANGCTKTTSVTITAPASMVVSASANALLCNGDSTAITTSATGGTGTKTFLINNATPLAKYPAGTYTIKATDANGCTKTTSVTITAPASITVSASANALLCNGDSTAITKSALGGTGTKTFLINNATPLAKYPAGTYTIKATDANGCTKSTSVTITAPAIMVVSASANALLCNGDSTAITTSAIGGTGTKTFLINNATPLAKYPAGTYTVKATDANGCTKTTSVTITAPASMIVSASANVLLCNGDSTAITTSTTGGTGTITYQINNATPLAKYAAGTYTIKATDANGCTKTTSVTITAPASMVLSASANALLCNGDSTAITTSTTGGTGTITYQINNATPLAKYPSGTYTIKATDANGCTKTTSVTITAPASMIVSASANALLCNGDSTAITTSTIGGTGTITYQINNATPLAKYPVGTYTIKATDANGCTKTTSVTITAPASMIVSASANALLCNGDSTAITTSAIGGTGTITYQINNATPFAKYPAGTYTVQVSDANACSVYTIVNINQPTPLNVQATANALIGCGNQIITLNGSGATTYSWTSGVNNNTPFVLGSTTSYVVTGTDANGCTGTSSIAININSPSNQLTLSYNANDSSVAGNGCKIMNQIDGASLSYYDANCDLIAGVADVSGGNVLGTVTTCVAVSSAVQVYNLQPFAARTYTITPTNQGPAAVTLYFTHDDITDYNEYVINNASTFPQFNNAAGVPINGATITNGAITKLANGGLGVGTVDSVIPVILTYNAAKLRWETTFNINHFSSFYLHTANPNLTPLSVSLTNFRANKNGEHAILKWETLKEVDNDYFVLERSMLPNQNFVELAKVMSKALNGNSKIEIAYDAIDMQPLTGFNYYRLRQIDLNKNATISKTVKVYFDYQSLIVMYPNPVLDALYIDVNVAEYEAASIKILDATGRTVKQIETQLNIGANTISIDVKDLPKAVYQIILFTEKGINYTNQFIKN